MTVETNRENMNVINDCLMHFRFSLHSELIQQRKEKFVTKFDCCHNPLWQFGIYFIQLRLLSAYLLYYYATVYMMNKMFNTGPPWYQFLMLPVSCSWRYSWYREYHCSTTRYWHHRPLAGTKLYCSVTEAHVCVNILSKVASSSRVER